MLRVVGIDPGSRHLGWGILDQEGTRIRHVAHGVIDTTESATLAMRLVEIDDGLREMLALHRPHVAAVEAIFFAKDAQAAAKLGHARGVTLLCLARASLPVFELPPARVKRAVVGGGLASKEQVARVITTILGLASRPRPDAADALANAFAHLTMAKFDVALAAAGVLPRKRSRARWPPGSRRREAPNSPDPFPHLCPRGLSVRMRSAVLSFATFETALGTCALSFSDEGVVATVLPSQTRAATLRALHRVTRARNICPTDAVIATSVPSWVEDVTRTLTSLLAGFDGDLVGVPLDMRGMTPFRRNIYEALRTIPRGARSTYGELAALAGSPGAARAVGRAMATNPWPLIVPCHRVVNSQGELHGFSAPGGIKTKAALLEIEAGAQPTGPTRVPAARTARRTKKPSSLTLFH